MRITSLKFWAVLVLVVLVGGLLIPALVDIMWRNA